MDRFEKAADFGKSMGTAAGALLGAGIGGGGTALYDWIRGNKQNRLRRALIGAGIGGGLGGAGGFIAGAVNDNNREAFNKEYDARQAMQKADREVLRQREALRMQKLKAESEAAHQEDMARRNAWKSNDRGFKMEDFLYERNRDEGGYLQAHGDSPTEAVKQLASDRGVDLNSEEWMRLWPTIMQFDSDWQMIDNRLSSSRGLKTDWPEPRSRRP